MDISAAPSPINPKLPFSPFPLFQVTAIPQDFDSKMAIPFNEQYFVEKNRNYKFLFLSVLVSVLLPAIHGVLFLWIPWVLRSKRTALGLRHKKYFTFIKYFDSFNKTFRATVFGKHLYFQPSLLVLLAIHIGVNSWFCVAETLDLDYEPWLYIVAKRLGRISVAHIPPILIFVAKNNLVSAFSGLSLDKAVFFHKWMGRSMFLTAIIHMVLSLKYWLDLKFYIMIQIPPQIFGFIAISCLGMLNLVSFKFIRNFAFEVFLAQHRAFNFIMLLLAYFHNGGNHAAIILGIHMLVIDRIVARVFGILHKYRDPRKGKSEFEILDDTTVRVSIPISTWEVDNEQWWRFFVPRYKTWRAGQHVLFNCNKVALLAYHPFTIASLAESGKMVLVIKVHKGFTRKLIRKLQKMSEEEPLESSISSVSVRGDDSYNSSSDGSIHSASSATHLKASEIHEVTRPLNKEVSTFKNMLAGFVAPRVFEIKAGINGPFGANYQPLTKFDSVVFFSAGSGASFTLPVALNLLKTLKQRDDEEDYLYRPEKALVTIVMSMKKAANLQWYDHLWEDFIPFLNSGRAHLSLHLTQEVPDASDYDEEIKEKNAKLAAEASKESTFESSSVLSAGPGFSTTYARPDFNDIITASVGDLCSPDYRKAFACIGCGPVAFNEEIKSVCEKNRWVKHAPDIYSYNESFD